MVGGIIKHNIANIFGKGVTLGNEKVLLFLMQQRSLMLSMLPVVAERSN